VPEGDQGINQCCNQRVLWDVTLWDVLVRRCELSTLECPKVEAMSGGQDKKMQRS